MAGELKAIAKGARRAGYVYDIKIRILIPNPGPTPDVLSEDWAHRVDRRVAEAQDEGFVTYRTERQYIVPADTVRTLLPKGMDPAIGRRAVGEGAIGGADAQGTERLGSGARERFILEDTEEGRQYPITGVQYLPDQRNVAIVAGSDVA